MQLKSTYDRIEINCWGNMDLSMYYLLQSKKSLQFLAFIIQIKGNIKNSFNDHLSLTTIAIVFEYQFILKEWDDVRISWRQSFILIRFIENNEKHETLFDVPFHRKYLFISRFCKYFLCQIAFTIPKCTLNW